MGWLAQVCSLCSFCYMLWMDGRMGYPVLLLDGMCLWTLVRDGHLLMHVHTKTRAECTLLFAAAVCAYVRPSLGGGPRAGAHAVVIFVTAWGSCESHNCFRASVSSWRAFPHF